MASMRPSWIIMIMGDHVWSLIIMIEILFLQSLLTTIHYKSSPFVRFHSAKWFTLLQSRDALTSMFIVSQSTQHHHCNAAIVSIDQIVHSCHLMAKHAGPIAEKGWTSKIILEAATQFFVNTYISVDFFSKIKWLVIVACYGHYIHYMYQQRLCTKCNR